MSNEWEDATGDAYMRKVFNGPSDGYEYKVMRRKVKTERDEFVEKANLIMSKLESCTDGDTYTGEATAMYDAGARFK